MKHQKSNDVHNASRLILAAAIIVGLIALAASVRFTSVSAAKPENEGGEGAYRVSKVMVAEDQMAGGGNLVKSRQLYKPHETVSSPKGFWITSNERGVVPEEGSEPPPSKAGITVFDSTTNDMIAELDIENLCIPVFNPDGSKYGCAPQGAESHPRHPHGITIDNTRNLVYQVIEHSGLKWNQGRTSFEVAENTDVESGLLVVYDITRPQFPKILAGYVLGHAAEEVVVNETNGKAYVGNHEPSPTEVPCFVSVIDQSGITASPYIFIDLPDENQCIQGIGYNKTLGEVFGTTHIGQRMYALNSNNDTIAYSVDIRTPFEAFIATLPVEQQFTIPEGDVIHMHDLVVPGEAPPDTEDETTQMVYQTIHTIANPADVHEPGDEDLVNNDTPAETEITGRWVAQVDVDPYSPTFLHVTIIDLSNGQSVPAVRTHEDNPEPNYAKRFVHAHFLTVDPVSNSLIVSGEHTGNLAIFDLNSLSAEDETPVNPLKVFAISRPIPGCTPTEAEPHVHGVDIDIANSRIYVSDEGEDCFYESVSVLELMPIKKVRADFDGDGLTDLSVFRPSEGNWYINGSTNGISGFNWGTATDTLVPADYDGDGRTDVAVFRASDNPGQPDFYILRGHHFVMTGYEWGITGDIPVVSDYDGDGMDDVAVFRPSNNTWYVINSSGGAIITAFGETGDVPMTGDIDGDGKGDLTVYRSGSCISKLSGGGTLDVAFELDGDERLAPGDYDGDGITDYAYVGNQGEDKYWLYRSSYDGYIRTVRYGLTNDVPVMGDYDGDGTDDLAIYRNGQWWMLRSKLGETVANWGIDTDKPIPFAYIP